MNKRPHKIPPQFHNFFSIDWNYNTRRYQATAQPSWFAREIYRLDGLDIWGAERRPLWDERFVYVGW